MLKGKYAKLMIGSQGPIIKVYEGDKLIWKSNQYIKQNVLHGTTSDGTAPLHLMINGSDVTPTMSGSSWEVECLNPTSFYQMFYGATNVDSVDFTDVDASQVTTASEMFRGCYQNLKHIDLTALNFSDKLTDMSGMFKTCEALESVIFPASWDTTNVTNIQELFSCSQTSRVSQITALDLSGLYFPNVTNANAVFIRQKSLQNLNVSGWDMSSAENMMNMFTDCQSLTSLDLSTWNVTVTASSSLAGMFSNCSSMVELDLSGIHDINKLTNQSSASMFVGCDSLDHILITDWTTTESRTLVQLLGWDKPGAHATWQRLGDRVLYTSGKSISGYTTNGFIGVTINGSEFLVFKDAVCWGNRLTTDVTSYNSSFKNCTGISSVDLSFTSAYGAACPLTDVTSAFEGCTNLQTITWNGFCSVNITASDDMFKGCDSLSLVITDSASGTYGQFLIQHLNADAAGGSTSWHLDPSDSTHLIP